MRRNLDRKMKVDEIRYKMDAAMRTSHELIARQSPERMPMPPPGRVVEIMETRGPAGRSPFGDRTTVTETRFGSQPREPLPPAGMPLRPVPGGVNPRDYSPAGARR